MKVPRQCQVCAKSPKKVKKCSVCAREFSFSWYYCSNICQEKDWQTHRQRHQELLKIKLDIESELPVEKNSKSLVEAIFNGNWQKSVSLLKAGANPRSRGPNGISILHQACLVGDVNVVKTILSQSPRDIVAQRLISGSTAHITASQLGHLNVLEELVKFGGKEPLLITSINGDTCLMGAAIIGDIKIVEYLLEVADCELIFMVSCLGASCLHMACKGGHADVAQLLVEVGGEVLMMKLMADGASCLNIAVQEGHLQVVQVLLAAGCRPLLMHTTPTGTCLHLAMFYKNPDIVRALMTAGGEPLALARDEMYMTCLHIAARLGLVDMARVLLESLDATSRTRLLHAGADRDATCLYLASQNGHLPMVQLLVLAGGRELMWRRIDRGAGATCLHVAAEMNYADVVGWLAGQADDELVRLQCDQVTCLEVTCFRGRVEAARSLLDQAGAELLSAGEQSCLLLAAHYHQSELLALLLQRGGEPELMRRLRPGGDTCLHLAAQTSHVDAVRALAAAGGASLLWARRQDGRTALHLACRAGRLESARALVELGGDELVEAVTREGHNIVHEAAGAAGEGIGDGVAVLRWALRRVPREMLEARDAAGVPARFAAVMGFTGAAARAGRAAAAGSRPALGVGQEPTELCVD